VEWDHDHHPKRSALPNSFRYPLPQIVPYLILHTRCKARLVARLISAV
jgi:hypothetical protein